MLPPMHMNKLIHIMQSKWLWLGMGLCVAGWLFVFNPTETNFAPQCTFKLLTGLDCPGCGFQRAAHAALHGHFVTAARYNFFLLYALPYLLGLIVTEWCLTGKRQEQWRRVLESCTALKFYVASFLIWGVIRNIFGW